MNHDPGGQACSMLSGTAVYKTVKLGYKLRSKTYHDS